MLLELDDPEGAVAAARTAHTIAASRDLDDKKNGKALAEIAVRLGDALRTRDADEDDQEQARAAYQQAVDLGAKRVGQATLGLAGRRTTSARTTRPRGTCHAPSGC
ncbi:hypothetical protein GCM10022225_83050 [Plantactinospora mayteni]|uniref:Tetratricopeptide repeat protein n=1 Tax=Plantactinospora mayteni TaxID=566021 RepID=A0ABQ4F4F6_9ACTN|nr:hypothetical protein Pma05_83540 [Plantactinospora mayteni]